MHLLSLMATEGADAPKGTGNIESIWLIIIAILVAAVLFSYSSRINNLDKMIKMLNDKINYLENLVTKLQNSKNKSSMRGQNSKGLFNDNVVVHGPFNEDNVDNPDELINTAPRISRLLDPRVKKTIKKDNDKEKSNKEE